MWQKCPICNGEGKLYNGSTSSAVYRVCDTCNGAKIISELTGFPPGYTQPKADKEQGDLSKAISQP